VSVKFGYHPILFIYCLRDIPVSSSEYMASIERVINKQWFGNDKEWSGCDPFQSTIQNSASETEKNTNITSNENRRLRGPVTNNNGFWIEWLDL
jgi:hypothetical protein